MNDISTTTAPSRAIIRNGVLTTDEWTHVPDEQADTPQGPVIVSLARWQRDRAALEQRGGQLGLRVPAAVDPNELAAQLRGFDLVAVQIDNFGDGRLFSLARILRTRFGFTGELRACGHVHPDQVFYMKRVGFDAFELGSPARLQAALRALTAFTVCYQGAGDDLPLYRQR